MHGETIKKKDVESVSCHVFRGGIIPQNSLLLHTCTILCVNYSCLNLDKCTSLVAVGAADAGTPVCCASRTNDVSEMSPV